MSQPITSSAALKAFLLKLEIDEALADILIGERITTIRKFTNMTTSFLDAVKEKATYTAIDNDINVIERFLPAHAHHLQSAKRFPNYESMDIATIDTIMATYEEKRICAYSNSSIIANCCFNNGDYTFYKQK